MSVIDLFIYCFNAITGLNFEILTLSELSTQAQGFTYWIQIFDFNFLGSLIIYLSCFYFIWKVTYQLFFRLFMHVVHFPKKRLNK